MEKKQRAIIFLAGILIAVGTALFTMDPMSKVFLIIIGHVVGIVNITDKESLIAMVSIMVLALGATSLSILPGIGVLITNILQNIAAFAWPAGIVIALKTFYEKTKN